MPEFVPSAAARLLVGVLAPGGNPHAFAEAAPEIREASLRLATSAHLDALLAAKLLLDSPKGVDGALAERSSGEIALARYAWIEGARVLEAIEGVAASPIALKGGDVAARAWAVSFATLPHRACYRAASDLDVLIAPQAMERVIAAIAPLGYEPSLDEARHHRRFVKKDPPRFAVEIHTDLFDRPHGLHIDLSAVRGRAVFIPTPIDGSTRRVLAIEDALAHVGSHAVYSDTLADTAAAIRSPLDLIVMATAIPFDATLAAARAQEFGLSHPLAIALDWTCELAPPSPAVEALRALRARLHPATGWRARTGRRLALQHAMLASAGRTATRLPFTATRAFLAPTARVGLQMLVEGSLRRLIG